MTFEQLRVFQAVVLKGTFRGAAEHLHKSQPAVSAMIKNLEEALSLQLFDRSSYRPSLTQKGKAIYDQVINTLRETTKLEALAQRLTGGEEAEVRIAVNRTFPLKKLFGMLKTIGQTYPKTKLTLASEAMGGAMERLALGNTDLALTYENGMDRARMESFAIACIRIIPVARADYGPATRPGRNSMEDVRDDVQVIVADSSIATPKHSLDVIPNARQWRVTDLADKKDIILAGMGWGGLPEHWIGNELASGELKRVNVAGFEDRRVNLSIIRRTDQPQGVVAEALWQAFLAFDQTSETQV